MKYLFFFFILTGCMIGPNYQKPAVLMPAQYTEVKDVSKLEMSLTEWWKIFDNSQLNEFVRLAIKENYDLKSALERIEEARSFYRIKKADLFPEVDINAKAYRTGLSQNLIQNQFFPEETFNVFEGGFDAVWEIDLFGKLRREKEASFYEFQSIQENFNDIFIMVISDVARYYFDIAALQQMISLANEKIAIQKQIVKLEESKFLSGISSEIPYNIFSEKLKIEEENLIIYQRLLKETYPKLALLLGKNPENIKQKLNNFILPAAIKKLTPGLPSTLLRRRPDIRRAERRLALSTAKIGSAIASYFPSFSLTGNSTLSSNEINQLFKGNSFGWIFGSFMNWPILTFGRIKANVDVRKAQERQAYYNYRNTIIQALKDVEIALATYYKEEENLSTIQKELLLSEKNSRLTESQYISGLEKLSSFLEQKKQTIDKQIKEIQSKRFLAQDLVSLYKALGGGDWN